MVKPRLYNEEDETKDAALWTLKTVLINSLKLLHPFMPFITEEIFLVLQDKDESIMISNWPKFEERLNYAKEENEISVIKEAVREIRNVRANMNVPPSKKVKVYVVTERKETAKIFEEGKVFFATLGYASEVIIQSNKENIDDDFVSAIIKDASIYMPFADLVDIEKELQRLEEEKQKLESEVDRVNKKLSNQGFVSKAPEKVISEEKDKLEKYSQMLEKVLERIKVLEK